MRGQGALEYLIIIAIVLSVSSIVVLYSTGIIGTQKTSVSLSSCKQASIDCKLSKMSAPTDPCDQCDSACIDSTTGEEIFAHATDCCKTGETDLIYEGTIGCDFYCGENNVLCEAGWTCCEGIAENEGINTCCDPGSTRPRCCNDRTSGFAFCYANEPCPNR